MSSTSAHDETPQTGSCNRNIWWQKLKTSPHVSREGVWELERGCQPSGIQRRQSILKKVVENVWKTLGQKPLNLTQGFFLNLLKSDIYELVLDFLFSDHLVLESIHNGRALALLL